MKTTSKLIDIPYWQNLSIENLEGEIWAPYPNQSKNYQVSNLGRVKSFQSSSRFLYETGFLKQTILKQSTNENAKDKNQNLYLKVAIRINGKSINKYVHRLVCETFISYIPINYHVDHKNKDTFLNTLSNLRIITIKENVGKLGGLNSNAKLNSLQVRQIRKDAKIVPKTIIAKNYNVSLGTIYHILRGVTWKNI